MTGPEKLVDALSEVADTCRSIELADWSPQDTDAVLRSATTASSEVAGLAARLRAVATGDCDSPPDLDGLCMECGRRIAAPVEAHKRGCPLDLMLRPADFVRLHTIRLVRYSRLVVDALRGSE